MGVARLSKKRAVAMLESQAADLEEIIFRACRNRFWADAERACRHLAQVFKTLQENEGEPNG